MLQLIDIRRATVLGTAALAFSATGCGAQIPAPPAPWVVIFTGGEALASVDTSRITVTGGVADVWLRFDYDRPDPTEGFQRVDVRERINCAAERVDDVVMELRDSTGRKMDEGPGTQWRTFKEHPFGDYVFPALCTFLAERKR